tara:strand:+ start:69 stop:494 length:426 start_codon:yes stop_codon:yes gene_type:complete
METDLTIKQKKYVKERLKGSTGVKAVTDIYNTTSYGSASALSTKLNKTPKIRKEIEKGLNKLDITPEYLLRELKNLISKGKSDNTILNVIKYYFDLLGYTKDNQREQAQRLVINIDKGVIPVNLRDKNNSEKKEKEKTQQV